MIHMLNGLVLISIAMKKLLPFWLYLLLSTGNTIAQDSLVQVKTQTARCGSAKFYSEFNRAGKMTFSRNDGMNGPITSISAYEYDSAGREIRSYWVHSNLGYYLTEMKYGPGRVDYYNYEKCKDSTCVYDRAALSKIRTANQFVNLPVFDEMKASGLKLQRTEYLDTLGNVLTELYFSGDGDTTDINYYVYEGGKEVQFHKGSLTDALWTWDIYYLYNEDGNLVKSYRVTLLGGAADTTEVRTYIHDDEGRLINAEYRNRGEFRNRTEYHYDSQSRTKKELFFEGSPTELDAETKFVFSKSGLLRRMEVLDFRTKGRLRKQITKYHVEYWDK